MCERIGDRWYKKYHSIYLRDVAGEILVTRLPEHKGLVPSRLESLRIDHGEIEICVSSPHYPLVEEGKTYTEDQVMCLIAGLASLEENLLVHGDIQPKNIVVTPDGLAMIDYTLVVSVYDTITVTQGYKDYIGELHADNAIQRCNPTERAIYALGITLRHLGHKKLSEDLIKNRPKSFAEILGRDFTIAPRPFEMITLNSSLYSLWVSENKSLYLLYNVIANNLPICSAIPNAEIESLDCLDNPEWIHDIPSVSGKFLTLYFLNVLCDKNESWGNLNEELPEGNNILVATEKLDFVMKY